MIKLLVSFMDKYRTDKPPLFLNWSLISHSNASNKLMFLKRFHDFYPHSRVSGNCISYMKLHSNGENENEIPQPTVKLLPWKAFPEEYNVFENVTYLFKIKPQKTTN